MAPKTRKASKATAAAAAAAGSSSSSDHLHPSSAAAAKPTVGSTASASASSSKAATVNGATHIPIKASTNPRIAPQDDTDWTWNPIKLVERKIFRAYWNVEATFSLSMLEAWEVLLVIAVCIVLTLLLWYSMYFYFPRHAQQVATRALYYVYGNSPPPQLAAAVTNNATSTAAITSAAPRAPAADSVLQKLIASSNQLWASLDAQDADQHSNPEVVDTLISNLNKVKQMIANTANTANTEL